MMDSIILRRFFNTDRPLSSELVCRNKSPSYRPSILQALTLNLSQQVSKTVHVPTDPINVAKKKKKKNRDKSSHVALYPAQCFGIMPVLGISKKSPKSLKFTWFNLRMLHTTIIMAGQVTMLVVIIRWASNSQINISIVEPTIWFSTKFVLVAYFVWLAKKWPPLMVEWENIEQTLPAYTGQKRNFTFFNQIKFQTILITTSLVIEHTLCILVGVQHGQLCINATYFEGYMKNAWPQIYTIIEYDHGIRGIFSELLNYYCTFQWTFMDIFIISISICLSTRFNQLNAYLKQYKGMNMSHTFWINQRQHFSSITTLIEKVDANISIITAFSVTSNLYHILLQLLRSFQPQDTRLETAYFWFSLTFIIYRTALVSLTAAKINDESQKPAKIIRAIPYDSYDSEANRFLEQVTNSKIGLTGLRFFYFTRPLILSVIGTIITYELVLVQFAILTPKNKVDQCKIFEHIEKA